MVILQTKPAEITREMALAMIDYLDKSLAATDGITLHLSSGQLNKGDTMLSKKRASLHPDNASEMIFLRGSWSEAEKYDMSDIKKRKLNAAAVEVLPHAA